MKNEDRAWPKQVFPSRVGNGIFWLLESNSLALLTNYLTIFLISEPLLILKQVTATEILSTCNLF